MDPMENTAPQQHKHHLYYNNLHAAIIEELVGRVVDRAFQLVRT